jgi:hypothetical protein
MRDNPQLLPSAIAARDTCNLLFAITHLSFGSSWLTRRLAVAQRRVLPYRLLFLIRPERPLAIQLLGFRLQACNRVSGTRGSITADCASS